MGAMQTQVTAIDDVDILNFALNLEYLEVRLLVEVSPTSVTLCAWHTLVMHAPLLRPLKSFRSHSWLEDPVDLATMCFTQAASSVRQRT